MKENRTLHTKDLILKQGVFEDWKDMYANLWSHEESAKYMLWKPVRSEDEAKERMRKSLKHQEESGLAWFIYKRKSWEFAERTDAPLDTANAADMAEACKKGIRDEAWEAIGFAGLLRLDAKTYEDTGIAIGPAFVGKGYGKQVLNALAEYCFEELGAERLICSCRSANAASRALQLSCGFRYTHSEGRTDPRNGEEYTCEFYERRRSLGGADETDGEKHCPES